MDKTGTIHRLAIALRHLKPSIEREVLVPSDISLDRLHQVIQVAMGWEDEHLHEFIVGERANEARYGVPVRDEFPGFGPPTHHEKKYTLHHIAPAEGRRFTYWYDFGDDWLHDIEVKAILTAAPDRLPVPRCLTATRACPPEDCGGPPGYARMLKILGNPRHKEYEDLREWLGDDDFDAGHVDVDAINRELATLERFWSRGSRKAKTPPTG